MRSIPFRRHQTQSHMNRRLKEDRNQHYYNLTRRPCYSDPSSWSYYVNPRRWLRGKNALSRQEIIFLEKSKSFEI